MPARRLAGAFLRCHRIPPSEKTLAVAAIGRDLIHNRAMLDAGEMGEALAQLTRLGVAHQNGVAEREPLWPAIVDRRLHLARALQRIEPRARWQIDRRQAIFARP